MATKLDPRKWDDDPGSNWGIPDEVFFANLQGMGLKPSDLVNPSERKKFEDWLKKHP